MANNKIKRDNSGSKVTIDKTEGGRYSVLGPCEDGMYEVRDLEEDKELSRGGREEGIALITTLLDDRLS